MSAAPHGSAVQALAGTLRERILDGDLVGGARLVEQDLCTRYDVGRHTARAALRALAGEGLVVVERNRGARVARLGPEQVRGLYELRTALEVEAARLALEAGDGRLPGSVDVATARLRRACERRRPSWGTIVTAHEEVHRELVAASGSKRLSAAHDALAAETRLFLVQLRPAWTLERMAGDHERLPRAIESGGPEALRAHIAESAEAVLDQLG